VVLDLGLSDRQGRGVLDWLRRRGPDGDGHLPVWVVMSALDQDDATRQYGPLGRQFLAKPFDPWVLVGLLQKLLGEESRIPADDPLARGPATSPESADGNTPRQPMK
jgi:CheY-like chemotaxis protein